MRASTRTDSCTITTGTTEPATTSPAPIPADATAGAACRCPTPASAPALALALAASVFDVYSYGDSRPGAFTASTPRTDLLLMRWTAVAVQSASAIAEEVRRVWLPRGCAWAAAAPEHGNAWAAAEHRWLLVHDEGVLRLIET